MSINKETLVTIFLSVVLVGLSILLFFVATPIFFSDDNVTQEEAPPSTEVPQVTWESVLYEGVDEDVATQIEEARETFYRERDYEAAINSLQQQSENTNLTVAEEARILMTMGQQMLRTDSRQAARILVSLYLEEKYPDRIRAEALETINWHFASDMLEYSTWEQAELRSPNVLTPRQFFAEIYGPAGLNIVDPDNIKSLNDARQVFIQAFEMVLDINTYRYISRVMLAAEYAKLATYADDEDEAASLAQIANTAIGFSEEEVATSETRSLQNNNYNNFVGIYRFYSFRTSYYLYFAGAEDFSVLEEKMERVFAYTDEFASDSYTAKLIAAATVEKFMLAYASEYDNELNSQQEAYLRELVINRFLSLPEEDFERRAYSKLFGEKDSVELDQIRTQKFNSYQYIARDVVPELQPVLINNVGGWTKEDFQL